MASLLAILFSLSLMAPLFASGPEDNLPECCRRAGKHHCSMNSAAHSGSGFKAESRCPRFPAFAGVTVHESAIAPRDSFTLARAPRGFTALAREAELNRRVSLDRAHNKRGPPSQFA